MGVAAARQVPRDARVPMVVLATAHPAKFGDAVVRATGTAPDLPPKIQALLAGSETYEVVDPDQAVVQNKIIETFEEVA